MVKINNALITGGTGGIGSEIVRIFASNGIKTYINYFSNEKRALELEQSFKNAIAVKTDIRSREQVKNMIADIIDRDSRIDVLINNAAPNLFLNAFEKIPDEIFIRDLDVILKGTIYLCKEVVPFMKKNKLGKIVNILTTAVIGKAPTHMSSYVIAKSGLLGLTKALSAELAPFNVQVNSISPYFVDTDMIKAFPQKLIEMMKMNLPSKKLCSPADIARIIYFLCVEAPNTITGVNLPISEGEVLY